MVARRVASPARDVGVEERPEGRGPRLGIGLVQLGGWPLRAQRTGRERGGQGIVEQAELAFHEVPDRDDPGGGGRSEPLAPDRDEIRERAQLGVVSGPVVGGHEGIAREEHEHRGHQSLGGIDRGERRVGPQQCRIAASAEGDGLHEVAVGGRGGRGRVGAVRDLAQDRGKLGGAGGAVVGPALHEGDVAAPERHLVMVLQLDLSQLVGDGVRGGDRGGHARTLPSAPATPARYAAGDGEPCGRRPPGQPRPLASPKRSAAMSTTASRARCSSASRSPCSAASNPGSSAARGRPATNTQ